MFSSNLLWYGKLGTYPLNFGLENCLGIGNLWYLVLFSSLSFCFQAVHSNLFIILFESCHVFPSLRELSLLHTLSHIPMNKSSLGIHQVKLVVKSGPGLSNGCCVGQHAHGPLYPGKVSTLNPVGHQSTNWMVLLVLMVAIAAFTSLGTTSPLYSMQQAMYLPWRGSHFTIWLLGSKQALVISPTLSCSW